MRMRLGDRLAVGGRDRDDLVPQIAHDHFDIHRDDRLVLDDQDARASLAVDLFRRLADQPVHLVHVATDRSEEHTSELQSLMRISYAVFCLKKKNTTKATTNN